MTPKGAIFFGFWDVNKILRNVNVTSRTDEYINPARGITCAPTLTTRYPALWICGTITTESSFLNNFSQ